jgi:hypothetical protein
MQMQKDEDAEDEDIIYFNLYLYFNLYFFFYLYLG